MALMQDAESRQNNIVKTPIDFPHEAVKGGQIKANKAAFEIGANPYATGNGVGDDEFDDTRDAAIDAWRAVTKELLRDL